MEGSEVEVHFTDDSSAVRGELRKLTQAGAWVFIREYSTGLKFFPMHRIKEIKAR